MKSLNIFLAAFILLAATDPVLAQEAQMRKGARNVPVMNRESVLYPNIRIHPNPRMQQYEVAIATHPSNPNKVLAVSMANDTGGVARARVGWHYTTNGGVTWTGRDTLPTHDNLAHAMFDPAVGIDTDGNLFVLTCMFTPAYNIRVSRSTDSGLNWTQSNFAFSDRVDQTHMTIDVNATSPYKNNVYIAHSDQFINPWPIKFSRSTNAGQDFSTQIISGMIVGSSFTAGAKLAVDPNGTVYATWSAYSGGSQLGFNKSTDGGVSWDTARSIRSVNYEGSSKGLAFGNYPSMDVDRSSSTGPRRGWIYIVYAEKNPTLPDIFLIRSTDNGTSWSNPLKVNQDNSGKDQFMPRISVDPSTGNLFVVYYDSRNFPANDSAEVYISASTDGGATFKDILVSDVPFLPGPVRLPPGASAGTTYMGSYIGIAALEGVVWPCWMDNRTDFRLGLQMYTARISVFTSVDQPFDATIPESYSLSQNYPNPFNPATTIQFSLPRSEIVTLTIFNVLGEQIAILVSEKLSVGTHQTEWEAGDLPSGVYFYRLQAGAFNQTRKLILLK